MLDNTSLKYSWVWYEVHLLTSGFKWCFIEWWLVCGYHGNWKAKRINTWSWFSNVCFPRITRIKWCLTIRQTKNIFEYCLKPKTIKPSSAHEQVVDHMIQILNPTNVSSNQFQQSFANLPHMHISMYESSNWFH